MKSSARARPTRLPAAGTDAHHESSKGNAVFPSTLASAGPTIGILIITLGVVLLVVAILLLRYIRRDDH